jgi:DNA adenine methylase
VGFHRSHHAVCNQSMTASTRSERPVTLRPMVSPLRYPGGKGALYSRLRELIRDSGLAGCTYVEPYAGGAGAGLSLLVTGQVEQVVINDLDPAIYAFWATLIGDSEWLIEQVEHVALSVEEWRRQQEIYRSPNEVDQKSLGFATFYLNRTNRSGVLNAGPIGGLDQTGNYKIDARFNRSDLVERIRVLGIYADQISVTSKDGAKVIAKYGLSQNTFIYADPPYFQKAGSLYLNAFDSTDHERLSQALNGIGGGTWLLTYDNVPQVHELYKPRRRRTFELHYSAHKVTKATEIAVLSDGVADVGEGWPRKAVGKALPH